MDLGIYGFFNGALIQSGSSRYFPLLNQGKYLGKGSIEIWVAELHPSV